MNYLSMKANEMKKKVAKEVQSIEMNDWQNDSVQLMTW